MDEQTEITMVKEREELMVPLFGDSKPVLRTAHFLQPTVASIDGSVPKLPSSSPSSLPLAFEPDDWPLEVLFTGWQYPTNSWRSWIHNLSPKYQSVWKKAGIYEAIMSSTYHIQRDKELVIGLAEKWCPETNTFIFPWAEATITLEDVMILGGFSVLGDPVSFSVDTKELNEVEDKLDKARKQVQRGSSNKASQSAWMKKFMDSGSEIEHEAFLSLWLARFVFKDSEIILKKPVFPIAARLARGERIVLAPAVLATIYRDLSLLKETIVASKKFDEGEDDDYVLRLTLWSPFRLVQLWAWERFQGLQLKPIEIKYGDPRAARWDKVKSLKVKNVRLALDSAGESFLWRPYAKIVNNWQFNKFCKEKGEWIYLEPGMDEELLSFALCLKVSQLVGPRCIEQYLPHRVAMQFGMDQDLPVHVGRCIDDHSTEIAWRNYIRPLSDTRLYIPSRFFKPDVTVRYLKWWKQSLVVQLDMIEGTVPRRKRSSRKRSKAVAQASKGNYKAGNDADVPPGFPPKCKIVEEEKGEKRSKQVSQVDKENKAGNNADVPPGFPPKCKMFEEEKGVHMKKEMGEPARAMEERSEKRSKRVPQANKAGNDADVPPGFPPKFKMVEKGMQINEEMGEPARAMEDKNERKDGNPVYSTAESSVESSINTLEVTAFTLDVRIARLERIFSEIKAARFYNRFEGNPTAREGCSHRSDP